MSYRLGYSGYKFLRQLRVMPRVRFVVEFFTLKTKSTHTSNN